MKAQAQISMFDEITVDGFCGGGGWSTGFEFATGAPVTIGINHNAAAIAMHKKNHPYTKHYNENIFEVDPRKACEGRSVGWAHFSPDCTHFSRAKGGKPVKKQIRGLAWVIVKWAGTVQPRIISMENVKEFMTWGPLIAARDKKTGMVLKMVKAPGSSDEEDKWITVAAEPGEVVPYHQQLLIPDKKRAGETFRAFCKAMKKLGYECDFKVLKASDYGAPTSRERLFGLFRRDGKPIAWPKPTHGDPDSTEVKSGKLKPWRTAAEIINWKLPTPSIFESADDIKLQYGVHAVRPLAPNTLKRIAKGIDKFVLKNPKPFILQCNHSGSGFRGQEASSPLPTVTGKHGYGIVTPLLAVNNMHNTGSTPVEPLKTITTGGHHMLITPVMTAIGQTGFSSDRSYPVSQPVRTVVSKAEQCLITPALLQYHSEQTSNDCRGQEVDKPLLTVDTAPRYSVIAPLLVKYYGQGTGQKVTEPLHTVTSKDREALAFAHIIKFKGTNIGQSYADPLQTITAKGNEFGQVITFVRKLQPGCNLHYWPKIRELLNQYCGYSIANDEVLILRINGVEYFIADVGLRMLIPRELFAANGFPYDYVIDVDCYGNIYPKSEQVARCGNSVPPPFATAIVMVNWPERCRRRFQTMAELNSTIAV